MTLNERSLDSAAPLNVHPVNFVEWRARAESFEALALAQTPPLNLVGPNGAEQIARLMTTSDLFLVFGIGPAIGRGFTEADTRPGAERRRHPGLWLLATMVRRGSRRSRTAAAGARRAAHSRRRRAAWFQNRVDGAGGADAADHRSRRSRGNRVTRFPVLRTPRAGCRLGSSKG